MTYRVYRRAFWRDVPGSTWPRGLEPAPRSERKWIENLEYEDEEDAVNACRELNVAPRTCEEERLGVKYEYTKDPPSNW